MEPTRHIPLIIVTILQFSKTVQSVEYIYPQNLPAYYNNNEYNGRADSYTQNPKFLQSPLTYNNNQQIWSTHQNQEQVLPRQEMVGGHEGLTQEHFGHSSEMSHHELPEEHQHSFVADMKKLGFEGSLKVVLALLPFAICLTFVPLLVITIGVLLIPIVRLKGYAEHEAEGRSLGNLESTVFSSMDAHKKYD